MIISIDVSRDIFAMDMLKALKSSLKHRRKHVLRPLQLWRPGFRDKNFMHDQVRQINMFSSVFLFRKSFQKKEQLATWLIDDRLM